MTRCTAKDGTLDYPNRAIWLLATPKARPLVDEMNEPRLEREELR